MLRRAAKPHHEANLYPHLDNGFFLRYCLPAAVVSYLAIAWQLRGRLRGRHIDFDNMDIVDANVADVRFLQAARHGDVMTPIELIEGHEDALEGRAEAVVGDAYVPESRWASPSFMRTSRSKPAASFWATSSATSSPTVSIDTISTTPPVATRKR